MRFILLLALALLATACVDARRFFGRGGRRDRNSLEVTCAQVKPQEICNGDAALVGFKVSDGCNLCTCDSQSARFTCTIKSCPREEELQEQRQKRKAARYCAKLQRKVQRKMQRYRRRMESRAAQQATKAPDAAAAAAEGQRWPIKCFKERKLCRQQPGVSFFDGCNRCRCPEQPSATAQCEPANTCPDFVGSKRDFKRHCRRLGASIDGAPPAARKGGNRRRQQRGDNSLMHWLAQRF